MTKPPIVAFQMDPLSTLKPAFDTSLMLAFEAKCRGYALFSYTPVNLVYDTKGDAGHAKFNDSIKNRSGTNGDVSAYGQFFDLDANGNITRACEMERLSLCDADFVLVRQNPPYDLEYLTAVSILRHLPSSTRVLNNPDTLRQWSEKTIPLEFPDLCPRTCLSANPNIIHEFLKQQQSIILKPLYEFGGKDVFIITQNDPNQDALIDLMCRRYPYGMIAQEFLASVTVNERRLLMINGTLKSVFKRIPKHGTIRSNVAVGGVATACDVTDADRVIERRLAPFLKEQGIMLCGVDAIDDRLIEVNVTSPTGLRLSERLYGQNLAKDFWDAVIKA